MKPRPWKVVSRNELIYNTDRNRGNLVITKDWQIWMIDRLPHPKDPARSQEPDPRCGRKQLMRVRELDRGIVKQRLDKYLTAAELDGILARRDKIVKFFDDEIAAKGEAAITPPSSLRRWSEWSR